MRCIFCLQEKTEAQFSDEHVFPEAIGGTMLIRTVCKPCNDYLGHSIDAHLTNHWFVQTQRLALGIKGKAKKVPNPLATGTLSDDATQKLVYVLNADGQPEELYVVPNISREKMPDGREKISMRVDASDRDKIPGMVNKMRLRAGMSPLTKEEEDRISATPSQRVDQPWMSVDLAIDLKEYQRAILKIAYELACTWLGPAYLNDPAGEALRNCIRHAAPDSDWAVAHPIRGRVEMTGGKLTFPFWTSEQFSHIAFIAPGIGELTCYVRIFQTFEGLVQVSGSGTQYSGFLGRFISVDPRTGVRRESSFSEELDRLSKQTG
jgi:hypothetical protein